MAEKKKRPVARRTLYLAIEEAITVYELNDHDSIAQLLEAVKDDWFKAAK